jgi:charged multivesicular body protein 4A/B
MWGWFGGAAAQKRKDAPKNAILMLRQQLDMLQKRERHLETQMAEQDAVARKNVSTNKTGMLAMTSQRASLLGCGQPCQSGISQTGATRNIDS